MLRDRRVCLLWVVACAVLASGCAASGRSRPRFSTPFGVGVGDAPVTAEQLDALGPLWYVDWQWRTPTLGGHERIYIVRCAEVQRDTGAIAAAMREHGVAWWALGNEPNDVKQDNVSPEEYAQLYATFESWARGTPGCYLLPAGIANADWQWAEAFREAYRTRYARYPRVDGWNIHNYILEPGLDPYDIAEFGRRIEAFRHWMESIGDGDKPLFLTEFGVLYGNGCCERPTDPPEKIETFMRESVQWLRESGLVEAWAWFATYSTLYNGNLMSPGSQLLPLGELYRDLAMQ